MAKALKCGQCSKLLASVKEAQDHGELTGHSAFEEVTEAIKVVMCIQCGKPCRTEVERGMHTRHTGHSEFVEAELNAEGGLNTEVQMADARADMEIDNDVIREALGKKKKADAGGTSSAAAGTSGGGEAAADGAAASGSGGDGAVMVAPEVDEALVTELEGMGFGRNRAVRAVYHSGGAGIEAATNWVLEHETDADIDTPLLVTQASEDAASKLTPEEKKKKAQDLIKSVKEKREKEERELAAHRERERIRAGKEIAAAKRKEDEGALAKMVEERKREKAEEAAARAKIAARLEEDRKERRRKLGLPEELTEEEKARDAQRQADKAAAAAKAEEENKKKIFGHVKPMSTLERMRPILVTMKKAHAGEEERWRTCASTLTKYIANIASNMDEEKYRTIKTTNPAFQQRVAGLTGAIDFLHICGFQSTEDGLLVMPRDKANLDILQGAGAALNDMLTNQYFGLM